VVALSADLDNAAKQQSDNRKRRVGGCKREGAGQAENLTPEWGRYKNDVAFVADGVEESVQTAGCAGSGNYVPWEDRSGRRKILVEEGGKGPEQLRVATQALRIGKIL
jgi:hypothetical protein